MLGQMQSQPLLISSLIVHAERHHASGEIVSRRVEGDIHRSTWREVARRSRQVANALDGMGLPMGDRVATLAWNGYRHLELYFGVSGTGRVLHTLNPRLHPEQLAWIINHADDRAICFDMTFAPLIQAVAKHCPGVKHWIALCDADKLPADSGIPGLLSYEAWIADSRDTYIWPDLDYPTATEIHRLVDRESGLRVIGQTHLGSHTELSLAMQHSLFDAHAREAAAAGFDVVFRRLWDYQFALRQALFRLGMLDAVQLTLTHRNRRGRR